MREIRQTIYAGFAQSCEATSALLLPHGGAPPDISSNEVQELRTTSEASFGQARFLEVCKLLNQSFSDQCFKVVQINDIKPGTKPI